MLYFAYGSNMSIRRLQRRLPSAVPIEVALLQGHRLAFHKRSSDGSGKCDVAPSKSDTVFGVIFEIDPEERRKLDEIEGCGKGYASHQLDLETMSGEARSAYSYKAIDTRADLLPFSWYKTHVLVGAREAMLPPSYIAGIEAVPDTQDPDPDRERRELEIYDRS